MIIIHGEDIKKSYAHLTKLLTDYSRQEYQIINRQIKEIDLTQFRQEISSDDLFAQKKVIVLHGLLSTNKSKQKDTLISLLADLSHHELVLYEQKDLTATALKPFKSPIIEHFKVSPLIFKLTGEIKPHNFKVLSDLYHQILSDGYEPEFVSAMLLRQVKLLLQIKNNPYSVKNSPYVKNLLHAQAKYFSNTKLIQIHHQLHLLDKQIKTGSSQAQSDHLVFQILSSI